MNPEQVIFLFSIGVFVALLFYLGHLIESFQ